jgi:hypothetical protein
MKTRGRIFGFLGLVAVGALLFARWAERPHEVKAPVVAGADEASLPAPYREGSTYRPAVAAQHPPRVEIEHQAAPVVNGLLQIGPVKHGPATRPAPTSGAVTAASWATSYSAAMCDCRTRACAVELQGHFIRNMGGVQFDQDRDGAAYQDAMSHALDCYFALPEGT